MNHLWIDGSAGLAGDMLAGALIDAGAPIDDVRAAVAAVLDERVHLDVEQVHRGALRGVHLTVRLQEVDSPHRHWRDIRHLIENAKIPGRVRDRSLTVFAALAAAESHVHGVAAEDVHFHEVGALDSIADVVAVAAGLESLHIDTISVGTVTLGHGVAHTAHGDLPVPVPAVLQLSRGWTVQAGGAGERTTPTGMAVVAALADRFEQLCPMRVDTVGHGAGTADFPDKPNIVRAVVGVRADTADATSRRVLETNVDDLDPRLWPGVLQQLLDLGADDAWLSPILMKKGRPAHTLHVLCRIDRAADLRRAVFAGTSTLGVREYDVARTALDRSWTTVPVFSGHVRIKLGWHGDDVVQATPEFDDVARVAAATGRSERAVLAAASVAAATVTPSRDPRSDATCDVPRAPIAEPEEGPVIGV